MGGRARVLPSEGMEEQQHRGMTFRSPSTWFLGEGGKDNNNSK